jgi:hypothetical protein
MTERFRSLPLLLAAATLLLMSISAGIAGGQAPAEICKSGCLPPPEEEAPPEEEELPPFPKPTPPKTMLVINVGWSTGSPETSSPLNEGALATTLDHLRGHFTNWLTGSAPASFPRWAVFSGGSHVIAPPIVPQTPCTEKQKLDFFNSLVDRAKAKVREYGIDPDSHTMVVPKWQKPVCGLLGIYNAGRLGLTNVTAASHEFGHHLGLDHAFGLRCQNAGGEVVALSGSCQPQELNDPYDGMSSNSEMAFGAIHANRLGWLNGQYFDVTMGDFTNAWNLKPFTDPAHTERALRLRDGNTTLWLEYRIPVGIDDPVFLGHAYFPAPGLVIHREMDDGSSQLLDMTPGSARRNDGSVIDLRDFEDARLPVGQTWANPLGEAKITLNSAGPAGATVTISSQRVTVPELRGLTVTRAEASLAALGLKSAGWSSIVDPTCAFIGLVVEQSPLPGARVLPGSQVNVTVGERDPMRDCQ